MEEEEKVRQGRPSLVHFSHHRVEVKNLQQRCGRLPSQVCSPLHTCTGSPANRERVQLQHLSAGALLKGALLQRAGGEAQTVSTVGKMVLIPVLDSCVGSAPLGSDGREPGFLLGAPLGTCEEPTSKMPRGKSPPFFHPEYFMASYFINQRCSRG